MNRTRRLAALSTLSAVLFTGVAIAQDDHRDDHRDDHAITDDHHDNRTYVRHDEWHKGARIGQDDWNRGDTVDYRTYHLKKPAHGYEWRRVDGNFVMASVGSGVIVSARIATPH
jgi:Ni/Co efflux regulator RcnB